MENFLFWISFILNFISHHIFTFKALDSYKLDSGEFPFQPDGSTDVTKILTRFYVKENGECEKFYYKGSGGNSNNFGTEHECMEHLAELNYWEKLEGCKEGYVSEGPCTKPGVTKYGYVASTNTCAKFNYGGCGGNNNRFLSEENCKKACEVGSDKKAPNEYDCLLPPKYPASDEVKISIVKSQDSSNTKCHYAIVDKTESRGIFPSFSKCLETCYKESLIGACSKTAPDQVASGSDVVVKFYYHKTDKACYTFLTKSKTTGFDSNSNYFNTEEECMSYCPVAEDKIKMMTYHVSKDICSMSKPPTASGSLSDVTKWYYNKNATPPACTSFTHGGIGDTNGLFDSDTECNKLCGNGE